MTTGAGQPSLIEQAKAVLAANDLGDFTKPAPALYPHQWNWDSCFIAIGRSHYDHRRAGLEILSLLRGQWENGMIPGIIFNPAASGYFPGPHVWECHRSPAAPRGVQTSGITDPPILGTAVRAIWENCPDKDWGLSFLATVYPKVIRAHEFLYRERNPDGDGLIVVLHPWESGLDNSPPYLDASSRVHLTYKPRYQRQDTQHVDAKERPSNQEYDLFVYLLEQMRKLNWDQRRYLDVAPLQVQDVLFNAILCRANLDLMELAPLVNADPSVPRSWFEQTSRAVNERLWDAERGTYFNYDRVAGKLLTEDTVAGFMPLFGRIAPENRAQQLIEEQLANPMRFWPKEGFPVPSTALDSSWFNPDNYWRGPTWVNTNWLIVDGLRHYRHAGMASELASRTVALISRSGFHEYFDCRTGEGYGTDQFGWSAALTIDLLSRATGGDDPESFRGHL